MAALAICAFYFHHHAAAIISWIEALGFIAPIFFLLLYSAATVLFLPTMVLTLAGGALFGPVLGTVFNLLGASIGAACAFYISRYMASDWLAAKKSIHIKKFMTGVEKKGWQFVALLRLIPVIPFNIVNYGLGVTGIKFSHYLITTIIFLIPAEIIFTYCGYAGMDILIHPGDFYKSTGLIFLGCLAVLLFLYVILKKRYQRQIIPES